MTHKRWLEEVRSYLVEVLEGIQAQRARKYPWIAALIAAILLGAVTWIEQLAFPLVELSKGSIAPYTIRATNDAVFDLHETVAAEAAEAKQRYIPIYNKDAELIGTYWERVLQSALAEPLTNWRFVAPTTEVGDGGVPSDDAGVLTEQSTRNKDEKGSTAEATEESTNEKKEVIEAEEIIKQEQLREIDALVTGILKLLSQYYDAGVIGDNEFPHESQSVRIFYGGEYMIKPVSELYRFSNLYSLLSQSAPQFFFKTNPQLVNQVVGYVLARLPPNLTYAKENEKFVADISQITGVKVVLIRRGEVLVRSGQVVDNRAYYAIRASVAAAQETSRWSNTVGRLCLLLALVAFFVIASFLMAPTAFRTLETYVVIFSGMIFLSVLGKSMLVYLPLHQVAIPQAALALAIAIVLGRVPGLLAAATTPTMLLFTQVFDLSTLLVSVAGGITGTMAVRRRRRGAAITAGMLVGIVQAVVFEACRVVEGRPRTYEELWASGQAFGSGVVAGVLALVSLPFIEWLLGKSSRGKLRVLTDFDHPLLLELRERAPGTFARTVSLVNLVEHAVKAVGGDRLLARAGTLFHDIGKMANPLAFDENHGLGQSVHEGLNPQESAKIILSHVPDGLRIAKRYNLPRDVVAFIPEHHGTTGVESFIQKAKENSQEVEREKFYFPGPKPQSIETAILMITGSVERASRALPNPTPDELVALVDRTIFKKFTEFQFDECGITQGELEKVKKAIVACLLRTIRRRGETPFINPEDAY